MNLKRIFGIAVTVCAAMNGSHQNNLFKPDSDEWRFVEGKLNNSERNLTSKLEET